MVLRQLHPALFVVGTFTIAARLHWAKRQTAHGTELHTTRCLHRVVLPLCLLQPLMVKDNTCANTVSLCCDEGH